MATETVEERLQRIEDIEAIRLLKHRYCAFCCLLYTSPSPRDATLSRMPSSA